MTMLLSAIADCPLQTLEPMVRRYVGALCGDAASVDDLVQEVYVRALQRVPKVRPRRLDRFLRGIARRVVQEYIRVRIRRRRDVALVMDVWADEGGDALGRLADEEQLNRLAQALAALPLVARRMIELRYLEGHSAEAVAEALAMTPGAVRVTCLRVRRRLLRTLS